MQIVYYKIIENCMWLKELGSPAATVDKVIYLSGKYDNLSPFLLNHELIHVAQQTRDGLDTFSLVLGLAATNYQRSLVPPVL